MDFFDTNVNKSNCSSSSSLSSSTTSEGFEEQLFQFEDNIDIDCDNEPPLYDTKQRFSSLLSAKSSPGMAFNSKRHDNDLSKETDEFIMSFFGSGTWSRLQNFATSLVDTLLKDKYTTEKASNPVYVRSRLTVAFGTLVFCFIPPWMALFISFNMIQNTIVLILCGLVCCIAIWNVRNSGASVDAITISANLICVAILATLTINSIKTGGNSSPLRVWLCTLPLISALLLGRGWALIWTLVVWLDLTVLYCVGNIPTEFPPELLYHMGHAVEVSLLLGVSAMTLSYQSLLDGAVQEIKGINSELLIAKEVAETENRIRHEFISVMSHEIRTPMNGIMGIIALLHETAASLTTSQLELVQTLSQCGNAIISLVDDMTDITSLQSGKIKLGNKPMVILDLLSKVQRTLESEAAQKNLAIITEIESNTLPMFMRGDENRIYQVLLKLACNAIKFTNQGGSIRLRASVSSDDHPTSSPVEHSTEHFVLFEVEDTGIGISQYNQTRIFDAFVQIEREHGGVGLGLAICKRLVEHMGGRIGVKSVAGYGSTFWFTLPLQDAYDITERYQRLERQPSPKMDLHDVKVLIVEDNVISQKVLMKMLEKLGYSTDVANNGKEALEKLQDNNYSIIFMDGQMPILDGYKTTQAIRDLESKNLKYNCSFIIGLTANLMPFDCYAAGMNYYLPKPLKHQQLLEALRQALIFLNVDINR